MSMELLLHGGYVLDDEIYELGNEVRTGMYTMMEKAAAGDD